MSTRPTSLRLGGFLAAGALAVALTAGIAEAKEIGSGGGGGGGGTTTCSPVSSFTVKADAANGETGGATIDVAYGVKPCTKDQALRVVTDVSEYYDPTVTLYHDATAPLNAKFTAFGVRLRVTYRVTVSVYDATTGALAGTASTATAAVPKGV